MKQKWQDFLDTLALGYADTDFLDQAIIITIVVLCMCLIVFALNIYGGF